MSVLAAGHFHLCGSLIEFRLRQQLALEEHLRALEVSFRKIEVGACIGDFRRSVDIEFTAVRQPEPPHDLSGVGIGLGSLRFHFRRCDPDECVTLGNARAALDRCCDDPPLDFRGDFSFFLSRQCPGHFEKALNRPLDGGGAADSDRRRNGVAGC